MNSTSIGVLAEDPLARKAGSGAVQGRSPGWMVLRTILLIGLASSMTVPFVWMLLASFKPPHEADRPEFLPEQWKWENYPIVLGLTPDSRGEKLPIRFGRWYFNSLFVASWVTFLQVVTSAMAAYAFARLKWRGRDVVFLAYLATVMVPAVVLLIPNYYIMFRLGLLDSYLGLILPAAFSAFGTFLLRQFMLNIPTSLDEAAEIDGASRWQVFVEVILPLSRPGLIVLAIMTFLGNYASFFWPLVMVKSDHLRTLPVGMMWFENLGGAGYGRQTELMMAATVMNIVPLMVLFVVLQRYLVRGIQLGAVKG
ncbi:MAG TPA: carbohydrate ABC transporter permease [Phycisphaerae bacterium]|nr:carbohydrate ABC transporter permease [Phycisphaerae bacterium]HRR85343.1 carbohydrate ABC transporter permease [Phycisphaerae bacterium]